MIVVDNGRLTWKQWALVLAFVALLLLGYILGWPGPQAAHCVLWTTC